MGKSVCGMRARTQCLTVRTSTSHFFDVFYISVILQRPVELFFSLLTLLILTSSLSSFSLSHLSHLFFSFFSFFSLTYSYSLVLQCNKQMKINQTFWTSGNLSRHLGLWKEEFQVIIILTINSLLYLFTIILILFLILLLTYLPLLLFLLASLPHFIFIYFFSRNRVDLYHSLFSYFTIISQLFPSLTRFTHNILSFSNCMNICIYIF